MIAAAGCKADPAEACPTIPQGMSFFIFFEGGKGPDTKSELAILKGMFKIPKGMLK
jgi:hypothetical protein